MSEEAVKIPGHAHLAHFLREFGECAIFHQYSDRLNVTTSMEQNLRDYLANYIGWPMTITLDAPAKKITIEIHDMPFEWVEFITVIVPAAN